MAAQVLNAPPEFRLGKAAFRVAVDLCNTTRIKRSALHIARRLATRSAGTMHSRETSGPSHYCVMASPPQADIAESTNKPSPSTDGERLESGSPVFNLTAYGGLLVKQRFSLGPVLHGFQSAIRNGTDEHERLSEKNSDTLGRITRPAGEDRGSALMNRQIRISKTRRSNWKMTRYLRALVALD